MNDTHNLHWTVSWRLSFTLPRMFIALQVYMSVSLLEVLVIIKLLVTLLSAKQLDEHLI